MEGVSTRRVYLDEETKEKEQAYKEIEKETVVQSFAGIVKC